MLKRTFEDFLREIHGQVCAQLGVLDDDMPDHYDEWITEKQVDDIIEWGTLYGREQFLAGQAKILSGMKTL